ncbi:hypothetical protein TCON_1068 [Astathelohania contejeani]|uniref:Uncharacterized protein n=1 Tax=Astathelohania contejeani TaxID=164912 RepID=A0ABQ7HZT1_9MICR|nr:hypothetical protein TCON_1068 [Thelohania contejeani]
MIIAAPIYYINSYRNHLIYSKGPSLHFLSEYIIKHDLNVHSIKIHKNHIITQTRSSIRIIKIRFNIRYYKGLFYFIHKKPNLSSKVLIKSDKLTAYLIQKFNIFGWILDFLILENKIYILTIRGELYEGIAILKKEICNNKLKLIGKIQTDNTSISAGRLCPSHFPTCYSGLIYGTREGSVFHNNKWHKKIHDGCIYDIHTKGNIIISCSEDRSMVITTPTETFRLFDFRSRIIKCGFISNNMVFYITESGFLRIFDNQSNLLFEKSYGFNNLTSIYYQHNVLYIGLTDGQIIKDDLNSQFMLINDEKKMNFNEPIFYNENQIILENNKLIVNDEIFELPIKPIKLNIINENALNQSDLFYIAIYAHKQILIFNNKLELVNDIKENVTSIYRIYGHFLIGTRRGSIIYKNNKYKICKDALTGIIIYNDMIILSCRDGFIYVIDIEAIKNKATKNILIGKKYIDSLFLEGLFCNEKDFFTYGIKNENFMIYSLSGKGCFNLKFTPKTWKFTPQRNTLEYIRNKKVEVAKLKYNINTEINMSIIKHYIEFDDFLVLGSDNGIIILYLLSKNKLNHSELIFIDKYDIKDCVTSMAFYNMKLFVGTDNSSIFVLKIYKNIILVEFMIPITYRCMSILIKNNELFSISSTGDLFVFDMDGKLKKRIELYGLYLSMMISKHNTLFLGGSDGNVLKICPNNKMEKFLRHSNTITHIDIYNDVLISSGDDHQLIITINEKDFKILAHSGTIVHFMCYHNNIFTLGIDRYVRVWNIWDQKLIKQIPINIYSPTRIMVKHYNQTYFIFVFGKGIEILTMNENY